MAKYTIKHTSIMHNGTVHKEGSVIELNEDQAKRLADFLTPVQETKSSTDKTQKTETKSSKTTAKSTSTAKTAQQKTDPEKDSAKETEKTEETDPVSLDGGVK